MEDKVKKISENSSKQSAEAGHSLENELKVEHSQKRWQASGEGYIGPVEAADDKLYNQLRNYSSLQNNLNSDDLFLLN